VVSRRRFQIIALLSKFFTATRAVNPEVCVHVCVSECVSALLLLLPVCTELARILFAVFSSYVAQIMKQNTLISPEYLDLPPLRHENTL
jgi:hypothetical protein